MATDRKKLANACFDALLIIDLVKACLAIPALATSLYDLAPLALSIARIGVLLVPAWLHGIRRAFDENHPLAASIAMLLSSPFRIASPGNLQALGIEFDSDLLRQKFNLEWEQCKLLYPKSCRTTL